MTLNNLSTHGGRLGLLLWGPYPQYNLQPPTCTLTGSKVDSRALAYLEALGVARTTYADRFLVEGAMPSSVTAPTLPPAGIALLTLSAAR